MTSGRRCWTSRPAVAPAWSSRRWGRATPSPRRSSWPPRAAPSCWSGISRPRADLPLQVAVTRELTLYGSATSAGEYPTALEMIAGRHVDVDVLISQVAPLSEGAAWLPRLRERGSTMLKVVLVP